MTEPGGSEIETGLSIGKGADDARSSPNLAHQSLKRCANPPPMLPRESIVGERLGDGVVDKLRGAPQTLDAELVHNQPALL